MNKNSFLPKVRRDEAIFSLLFTFRLQDNRQQRRQYDQEGESSRSGGTAFITYRPS